MSRLVFGNDPFIAVVKMPTNIKGKKVTVCAVVVALVHEFIIDQRRTFAGKEEDLEEATIVGRVVIMKKNDKHGIWWWMFGKLRLQRSLRLLALMYT